jgi:hypothetical protein
VTASSVERPASFALSSVIVELAMLATMGAELRSANAPGFAAGRISRLGIRRSAFINSGFSAGPLIRSSPAAKPPNPRGPPDPEGAIHCLRSARSSRENVMAALPV